MTSGLGMVFKLLIQIATTASDFNSTLISKPTHHLTKNTISNLPIPTFLQRGGKQNFTKEKGLLQIDFHFYHFSEW